MAAAVGRQERLAAAFRPVENADQVDAALGDQPAAEFEREAGRRQQLRPRAHGFVERIGEPVEVNRLLTREAGHVEAAAEVQLGKRLVDLAANLASTGDDRLVRFDERAVVEALRRRENMKPAPVDIRLEQGA